MWSWDYEKCQRCGTTEVPHKAQGLCVQCYAKLTEKKHKLRKVPRGSVISKLDYDSLYQLYITEQKSMADIAKIVGGSRQYINKRLRELGIPFRDKKSARQLALKSGKVKDLYGQKYQSTEYITDFFKTWTPEMAYVLGLIYTDGCLYPSKNNGDGRKTTSYTSKIMLAQKDISLLENVRLLMGTNTKISSRKNNGVDDAIYCMTIHSNEMYEDLLNIGLTPKKSLTVDFPNVPEEYEADFIRGLWDGDGCIYKNGNSWKASFVSGSKQFIETLKAHLAYHGIETPEIYPYQSKESGNWSYTINLTNKKTILKLRTFLYGKVEKSIMYLQRKYDLFNQVR